MAVFQGARLRTAALPPARAVARPRAATVARPRATRPAAVAAGPRARSMGLLLAGILAATMLGLVYLTQTLGTNATTSEIRHLEETRQDLEARLDVQAFGVTSAIDSELILEAARAQGLKSLRDRVVLRAP